MQWLATVREDRYQEAVAVAVDHCQVADHQRTLLVDGRKNHQVHHQVRHRDHRQDQDHHQDRHQVEMDSMEGVCLPHVCCTQVSS